MSRQIYTNAITVPPPSPSTPKYPAPSEVSWPWLTKWLAVSDLMASCAISAIQPWATGVNVAIALTHSEESAFIYLSPLSMPTPPPSSISPALQNQLHYCCLLFFTPVLFSFRDVNKSDSRGCWNDTISLSAGSLISLLLCPHHHHQSLLTAAGTYIILDIISVLEF